MENNVTYVFEFSVEETKAVYDAILKCVPVGIGESIVSKMRDSIQKKNIEVNNMKEKVNVNE